MRKLIGSLFASAVMTLAAGGAIAKDSIGTVVLPFEYDNQPVYVDCLGEIVDGHVVGEARYHQFTTPSGVFHILDQWRFSIYTVGTISGRVWVSRAVSPFQMNTKLEKGAVQQWVSKAMFVPLGEHAPAFVYENSFKVTVNANGDVVVFNDEIPPSEGFRCLGRK